MKIGDQDLVLYVQQYKTYNMYVKRGSYSPVPSLTVHPESWLKISSRRVLKADPEIVGNWEAVSLNLCCFDLRDWNKDNTCGVRTSFLCKLSWCFLLSHSNLLSFPAKQLGPKRFPNLGKLRATLLFSWVHELTDFKEGLVVKWKCEFQTKISRRCLFAYPAGEVKVSCKKVSSLLWVDLFI